MKKLLIIVLSVVVMQLHAQPGTIASLQKISATEGNLTAQLDVSDFFGYSVANIGDVDKDGVTDIAVGSILFEDSSQQYETIGAVYILFLEADGKVKSYQLISEGMGGFTGALYPTGRFGVSVEGIGDLNGDSIPDLAVGQVGLYGEGYVWILFLNIDGRVKSSEKIGYGNLGGFTGNISIQCFFGSGIANMGDINGDGITDLAVGSYQDDDGYSQAGAVWILFMNTNGTVKANQKISALQGGFNGTLTMDAWFGSAVEPMGDINNDGISELLVGESFGALQVFSNGGEVWVLYLDSTGQVTSNNILYGYKNQLGSEINKGDYFGSAISLIGDVNKDGVDDIAVGSYASDELYSSSGSVLVLFPDVNYTITSVQEISATQGNLSGLEGGDAFGTSVTGLGDLNGDGTPDISVGAIGDDDGGQWIGAVYNCFLEDGIVTTMNDISYSEKGIVAYPNPTTGLLNINMKDSKASIKVYNLSGELVFSSENVSGYYSVDLSGQSNGLYLLKVKTEQESISQKIQLID